MIVGQGGINVAEGLRVRMVDGMEQSELSQHPPTCPGCAELLGSNPVPLGGGPLSDTVQAAEFHFVVLPDDAKRICRGLGDRLRGGF